MTAWRGGLVAAALLWSAAVLADDSLPSDAAGPPPDAVLDERPALHACEEDGAPSCETQADAATPAPDERASTDPVPLTEPSTLPSGAPPDGVAAPADPASVSEAPDATAEPATADLDGAEPREDPRAANVEPEVQHEPPPVVAPRERVGFGGVPALNYDADNGFGFGVVATLYGYEEGVTPYRYALTLVIFATTRLVQDHQIRFDAVDLFDLPLRLTLRGGYFQSVTQNFCGFGNAVTCDPGVAEVEAARLDLSGDDADTFARRYYLKRVVRPFGQLLARWRLLEEPTKLEVMGGYRGHLYLDGDPWADDDKDGAPDLAFAPYPGSLYAKTFPGGQDGYASVVTLGLMVDDRDEEASPTRGYWIEGSVRVSSSLLGSAWNYVGGNLTLRTYVALLRGERNIVLAQRLVLDATAGDLPVQEMVRVGGSWDYTGFGGNPMGRGVRLQRYIGRLKAFDQVELRADLYAHELLGQRFRWGVVGLVDAGWTGVDWTDLGGDPLRVNLGFGGGLRLAWNEDFIIRADVATSPDERYAPAVYIDIGNTF